MQGDTQHQQHQCIDDRRGERGRAGNAVAAPIGHFRPFGTSYRFVNVVGTIIVGALIAVFGPFAAASSFAQETGAPATDDDVPIPTDPPAAGQERPPVLPTSPPPPVLPQRPPEGPIQIEVTIEDPDGSFQSWEENLADLAEPERLRRYRVFVIPYPFLVRFANENFRLRLSAEELVIWQGMGEESRRHLEFFAAGNVRMEFERRKDGTVVTTDLYRAEQVFFSLTGMQAVIQNLQAKIRQPNTKSDFYIRAREFRLMSPLDSFGDDAMISITPFALPWLHLRAKHIRFRQRGNVRQVDVIDTGVFLRNTKLAPFFDQNQNLDRPPFIRNLAFNQSERYGFHLITDFDLGLFVHDNLLGKTFEDVQSGRIIGGVDLYSERGVAPHGALRYRNDSTDGGIYGWYIHDSGDNTDFGRDRGLFPLLRNDRSRVRIWHNQEFPLNLMLNAQLSYLSDANLLFEFFREEFDARHNQKTYVDLARYDTRTGVRVFFQRQINEHDPTIQYQPRVQFFIYPAWIFELPEIDVPFYFTLQTDIANVGFRPAQNSGQQSQRSTRLDLRPGFVVPIDAGIFGFSQSIVMSTSWYGWDVDLRDVTLPQRVAFEYRAQIFTNIFRTFDVSSDLLDIQGLRHIITPEIVFFHRFPVTYLLGANAASLPVFDEIDRPVNTFDVVEFYLTNVLQGLREGRAFELLRLRVEFSYFPRPTRDNDGNHFGPLVAKLTFNPRPWLSVATDIRIDVNNGNVTRYGVGGRLIIDDRVSLSLSHRIVRGVSTISAFSVAWRASPAYRLSFAGEYDFSNQQVRNVDLTVQRLFQEFALNVNIRRDFVRNDVGIFVTFAPLGFGDSPDIFQAAYGAPR